MNAIYIMLFMIFSIGMFFFFKKKTYAIHMTFSNSRDGIAQKYVFLCFFNIEDVILNHILFISALRDDAEEFLWDEHQPW